MRTIGVVTVGRSDFGIYLPILREIQNSDKLRLRLIVSGAHLCSEFGSTVDEIISHGFHVDHRVEMLLASDTPTAMTKSMALGMIGFSEVYAQNRPDLLLVLGDRFEMHAAASAAIPHKIPLAHVHGGEVTEGAIDDVFRHAITKYSHVHFVATEQYARRVIQLGEDPARVFVCGAPALDNLKTLQLLDAAELERRFGLRLARPPILVTFHPATLQDDQTEQQFGELLKALDQFDQPMVFTKPNADTNCRVIIDMIEQYVRRRSEAQMVDNLGVQAYFSLMKLAAAMVGNSSSGIIEAASFELPVVNVGIRQQGRTRSKNVLDVGNTCQDIITGLQQAFGAGFRKSLAGMKNLYGDSAAAPKIVDCLERVVLDESLLIKQFHDLEPVRSALDKTNSRMTDAA